MQNYSNAFARELGLQPLLGGRAESYLEGNKTVFSVAGTQARQTSAPPVDIDDSHFSTFGHRRVGLERFDPQVAVEVLLGREKKRNHRTQATNKRPDKHPESEPRALMRDAQNQQGKKGFQSMYLSMPSIGMSM